MNFGQIIASLLNFIGIIFIIMVAVLAFQKISGTEGKLMGFGAILMVITGLSFYFIQFILISSSNMNDIGTFYSINAIVGNVGRLLFFIGLFLLLKNLVTENEYSD